MNGSNANATANAATSCRPVSSAKPTILLSSGVLDEGLTGRRRHRAALDALAIWLDDELLAYE